MDLGEAWNVLAERRRDVVIRPPKPPILAADAILECAADPSRRRDPGVRGRTRG
jgi:hypothetical protein